MAQFWTMMQGVRGSGWSSQYGDVGGHAFKIWCRTLQGFDADQIKKGFDRYVESGGGFLDAIKFREFVENKKDPHAVNSSAYKPWEVARLDHEHLKERDKNMSDFQKTKLMPAIRKKILQGCTLEEYQAALDILGRHDSRFKDLVAEGETGQFAVKKRKYSK